MAVKWIQQLCSNLVVKTLPPVMIPKDEITTDEMMGLFSHEVNERLMDRTPRNRKSFHDIQFDVIQDWDKQGYVTDEVLARLVTDKLLHVG